MRSRSDLDETPAGLQLVLPGAERLSPSDMAKKTAAEPMRATVAQKACDVGLFGDAAAQIDLEDLTRR